MKIFATTFIIFFSFSSYPSLYSTAPLQQSSLGFKTKHASRGLYEDMAASECAAWLRMSELDTPAS